MSKHDTVSADTTATTLSVSATATAAPASTDITEWVISTRRALVFINDEIRELKKRRKHLKKALKKYQ